ncbi:MAG TPA: SDR family NAD(P)-dependent oxidoreductase, partial [Alphaproteobacteria bacterium]|nr:SDR family NAD(P)-dependent oxidoreductase [Alphaproteobacteria bacterium]
MASKEHAIIIGVGPGLGAALVERCAREGMAVTAGARNPERLRGLLDQRGLKDTAAIACDVTDAASVD